MTNKHKYLLLEIKYMLIKTIYHFLPIKITCQGTAFFHLQVCSRTYLPLRCCPRVSGAETTSYTAFAGHHFISFQLRHWESPDTRYLFQASWMKGRYSFFSFVIPCVGWIPAPSFLIPHGLTKCYWNSFSWISSSLLD